MPYGKHCPTRHVHLAAGDNYSPNPGSHATMGPNGICPKSSFSPFLACDSGGECGSITSTRYNLPNVPTVTPAVATTSGTDKQKWFSYNYGEPNTTAFGRLCRLLCLSCCTCTGPIHFLLYSTEIPFSIGSPQYQCASPLLPVACL